MSSHPGLQTSVPIGIKNNSVVASLMLVIYEHALTFDDEVNWIWAVCLSIPGVLVLILRYFAIFSRIVDTFGDLYVGWSLSLCEHEGDPVSSLIFNDYNIMVFALYGTHPILIVLVLPFIGEMIVMVLSLYMAIGLYWVIPLIGGTAIFILTVKKNKKYIRVTGDL
ncbi:hypothetical protein K439DRAFT_1518570 [Ramaria rubella]|nr:hypothetical protein K439DRAFT_1518570 [Ramaria rubella]